MDNNNKFFTTLKVILYDTAGWNTYLMLLTVQSSLEASKIVFQWPWISFWVPWKIFWCLGTPNAYVCRLHWHHVYPRNNREGHTTLQSDSMIVNVRTWLFFEFHTPSKTVSLHGIIIPRNHEKCGVQLFSQNTKLSISQQECEIFLLKYIF